MSQNDKFMELYSQSTEANHYKNIPNKELYDNIVKFLLENGFVEEEVVEEEAVDEEAVDEEVVDEEVVDESDIGEEEGPSTKGLINIYYFLFLIICLRN